MAAIDPSSNSDPRKKNWVDGISKIFNDQLKIDIEAPCVSIFRLPDSITAQKPQAYEPQQIGLGPYHHFRPGLYEKMERKKLAAMRRVLKNHKIFKDFEAIVLDKVMNLVPVVLECYDRFLQDDNRSLAWVLAMDGLFLLDLFRTYNLEYRNEEDLLRRMKNALHQYAISAENDMDSDDRSIPRTGGQTEEISRDKTEIGATSDDQTEIELDETLKIILLDFRGRIDLESLYFLLGENVKYSSRSKQPEVDPVRRSLAQDIIMLENQIPFMALKELNDALYASSSESFNSRDEFSPSIYRSFTEIHSPLELCSPLQAPAHVEHLLHYMYHSIVNNVSMGREDDFLDEDNNNRMSSAPLFTSFDFITKIAWDKIVQIYEQTLTILETFSQSKTIIASAFKLHKRAGFRFRQLSKYEGIQNIQVNMDRETVYLPCVTLNHDSEVILRNLVAYETSIVNTNNFPLTDFVALMCALIVNVNDVKLLQIKNIIQGGLEVGEVVKLFTSMRSSVPSITTKDKSELRKTIEDVNSYYESRFMMKVVWFFKKIAYWLLVVLRAIGGFVKASWKFVAYPVGIVTAVIVIWKAYCGVYGCDSTNKASLNFAPR